MYVRTERHPDLPPPVDETGVLGWLRTNLFSSVLNTMLTVLGLGLLYLIVPPFVRWAIIDANWAGTTREDCIDALGACWVFIKVRFPMLMYGFFPDGERWRIDLTALLFVGSCAPLLLAPFLPFPERINTHILRAIPVVCVLVAFNLCGPFSSLTAAVFLGAPFVLARLTPHLEPLSLRLAKIFGARLAASVGVGILCGLALNVSGIGGSGSLGLAAALFTLLLISLHKPSVAAWQFWFMYLMLPCLAWVLLLGGVGSIVAVPTDQWGGLFLTIVIALTGMAASLPIGILLALGRTSSMPVVRMLCISFIEFARGVPLISVLFMVSVMLPMMLSEGAHFDKLLRALIGVSLFYAAYMAEVVRGGLQAIPKGQYEAAQALGLRYWAHMRLIILPQALRLTIPAITNTFLGLMKDTTLVAVINLMDILGIVKSALADTRWLGFTKEAYFFSGLIFWILCFIVSRYSLYLEQRLNWKRK